MKGPLSWQSGQAVSILYIPHGSDESLSHAQAVLEAYTFISHMVQMKVERCLR